MSTQTPTEQHVQSAETSYLLLNQHIVDGNLDQVIEWLSGQPCPPLMTRRPFSVRDPVCLAAERGQGDIFDLLVHHGFSYRSLDIGGPGYRRCALQPIHLAAQKGHLDLLKKLVEVYKADVNSEGSQTTPLHLAVTDSQGDVVNYLLRHGADALWSTSLCRNVKKRSPLVVAIRLGYWDLVCSMIDNLLTKKNFPLGDTLDQILQRGRKDIAYLLYEKCPSTVMYASVLKEHPLALNVLHFLLEVHDSVMYDVRTCVFDIYSGLAANTGQLTFIRMLHGAGSPISSTTKSLSFMNTTMFEGPYSDLVQQCLRTFASTPYSLKDLSIFHIRRHLGRLSPTTVDNLPLPTSLKRVIRLDHLKHYLTLETVSSETLTKNNLRIPLCDRACERMFSAGLEKS